MNKKKILITGSCGFIFSNFIRHLLYESKNYTIVSLDNISDLKNLHNIYSNKSHSFYVGDITDKHFVNCVFELEKPDFVINGANEKFDNKKIISSNVYGTQNLLEASNKYNIEKFICVSSDQVYGFGSMIKEDDKLNPLNLFSASKASSEILTQSISKNVNYNIVRLCNVFGQRQLNSKFIPITIRNILNNEKTLIYDKGKNTRTWMYILDACSAILYVLENGKEKEIYNISSNWEFSNIEIFNEICNSLELGHDLIEFKDSNSVIERTSCGNKLRDLGWSPQWKFKDSLKYTAKWYNNNQWIFR